MLQSTAVLGDCLEYMKKFKDMEFDIAVVDPPYGIEVNKMSLGSKKYKTDKVWDNRIPEREYFKELFRVSKFQVIWGANYMLSNIRRNTSCMLVWNKKNGNTDFADCELAWTNFDIPVRMFEFGLMQQNQSSIKNRFHPTQKPIELYSWIFNRFCKTGWKVLDTHLGSQNSRIAAYNSGMNFFGIEIDEEYYNKGEENFKKNIGQISISEFEYKENIPSKPKDYSKLVEKELEVIEDEVDKMESSSINKNRVLRKEFPCENCPPDNKTSKLNDEYNSEYCEHCFEVVSYERKISCQDKKIKEDKARVVKAKNQDNQKTLF